jgi:hypothetical protein
LQQGANKGIRRRSNVHPTIITPLGKTSIETFTPNKNLMNSTFRQANNENEDVTGKRGADYYSKIIASSKHPERLAGSLPTVSFAHT